MFKAAWLWGSYPEVGPAEQVKAHLETLSHLDLTPLDKPEPELEYMFKHITTQEVAYESLAVATRARCTSRWAAYIERRPANQMTECTSLLAYHYGRSPTWPSSASTSAKAGDAAPSPLRQRRRHRLLRPPVAAAAADDQSAVQRELGEVRQLIGQWPEAEAAYRQALEMAQAHGDAANAAHAQSLLGRLLAQTASHAEALAWLEPARATFERLGDAVGLGRALEHLSFVYSEQGQFAAALEAAERHLALARARAAPTGCARPWATSAWSTPSRATWSRP